MGRLDEYKARLGYFFDVPQDTVGKTATVEIRGFREVMILGCTGILDYSTSAVILESRQGKIVITGCDMRISVFSDERVIIYGVIDCVSKGESNG